MKIAILGGGLTGLTAAYNLAKKGHQITILEKEKILGGLAAGFKQSTWQWYLERAYHHLFANDEDILRFTKEIGFNNIIFKSPETASLYQALTDRFQTSKKITNNKYRDNYRIFSMDSPQDFLRFPLLSWSEKIRAGAVLAFLKFSPFFSFYEKQTAKKFLKQSMGDRAWEILWQQLFRKKFGKHAENILASFIWARIKKRTKNLGYIKGGFQTFVDYLKNELEKLGVKMLTNFEIKQIEKRGGKFQINQQKKQVPNLNFDVVVSTLPTPVLLRIGVGIFPKTYSARLKKINYLHALNLIIETKQPLLNTTYWLNICVKKLPLMIVCQHTNFVDKRYYGNNHLAYLGWYVEIKDRLWKMEAKEILEFVKPHLSEITSSHLFTINYFLFYGLFAQPIFDKYFLQNKPTFETPVKNFYIANLDMTYPYDRGTNYAVRLGKRVSSFIT